MIILQKVILYSPALDWAQLSFFQHYHKHCHHQQYDYKNNQQYDYQNQYCLFQFSTTFLYFSQVAKLLPFLHATINPIIFWFVSCPIKIILKRKFNTKYQNQKVLMFFKFAVIQILILRIYSGSFFKISFVNTNSEGTGLIKNGIIPNSCLEAFHSRKFVALWFSPFDSRSLHIS